MKSRLGFLKKWMDKRSDRDKFYLFLLGFIVIFFVNFVVSLHPLLAQKKHLQELTFKLQTDQASIEEDIQKITIAASNPDFIKANNEQKQLQTEMNQLNDKILTFKPKIYSSLELLKVTEDILDKTTNNVTLISLKELPSILLLDEKNLEKSNLFKIAKEDVYKYILQLEFEADYFSAIDYLKKLESLQWSIYWDTLDYTVTKYPKAKVVAKFYMMTDVKS